MTIQIRQFVLRFMVCVFAVALTACAPTSERRGTGEFVDDASLTARVKTALVKAEGIKDAVDINVNSYRGEVQLTGFVESQDMINRAVAAARGVDGVRAVRNDLRVGKK